MPQPQLTNFAFNSELSMCLYFKRRHVHAFVHCFRFIFTQYRSVPAQLATVLLPIQHVRYTQ